MSSALPVTNINYEHEVGLAKHKLNMLSSLLSVYIKFKVYIWQCLENVWKNFAEGEHSWSDPWFPLPPGTKNCPTMTEINRSQESHNITVYTKSEWFDLISKAKTAEQWIGHFAGWKLSQIDPTTMKHILYVSCHVLGAMNAEKE